MADVQIAVIDTTESVVNVAVPGIQGPVGTTGSVTIAQAGTAATPGIRFESDTNTGIYSPGADQLAVSTGGTGRLFVDASGAVGVNTNTSSIQSIGKLVVQNGSTTANERLIVAGNAYLSTFTGTYISQGDTATTGTTFGLSNTNLGALIFQNTSACLIGSNAGAPLVFATSASERLRITSAGLVGIGTSAPSSIVDIKVSDASTTIGGSTSVVRVNNGSGQIGATSGLEFFHGNDTSTNAARLAGVYGRYASFNGSGLGGELIFATNTPGDATIDERLRITSAGNVGIGTTSPTTLLDVNADTVRVRTARTPASASATGATGEICWDANYIYVCTATNTWKRSAISTW